MSPTLLADEPVIISALGSAAVWGAVFGVFAAFGHPLTPNQQTALLALVAVLGTFFARSQVVPAAKVPPPAPPVDASRVLRDALVLTQPGPAAPAPPPRPPLNTDPGSSTAASPARIIAPFPPTFTPKGKP